MRLFGILDQAEFMAGVEGGRYLMKTRFATPILILRETDLPENAIQQIMQIIHDS